MEVGSEDYAWQSSRVDSYSMLWTPPPPPPFRWTGDTKIYRMLWKKQKKYFYKRNCQDILINICFFRQNFISLIYPRHSSYFLLKFPTNSNFNNIMKWNNNFSRQQVLSHKNRNPDTQEAYQYYQVSQYYYINIKLLLKNNRTMIPAFELEVIYSFTLGNYQIIFIFSLLPIITLEIK